MRHKEITAEEAYIRRLYAAETPLQTELRETLAGRRLSIHVSPEEGKILNLLVRLHRPKHIVEIGTLGGYSALWMAQALPEGGHLTTFEKNASHAALAREYIERSPLKSRITVVEGDAHALLRSHTMTAADMVFIDAEKTGYPDYLSWAESVLKPGGVVVGDNTKLFGAAHLEAAPEGMEKEMWQAMRAFNQRLADPKEYHAIMLPTAEGLTVAIRA